MPHRRVVASLLIAGVLAWTVGAWSPGVSAQTAGNVIVGLTANNQLLTFQAETPGQSTAPVTITGLQAGETILAIDYRAVDGRLYGLGSTNRVYTLSPANGQAVLAGGPFSPTLTGPGYGFDINPVDDRIRITTSTDQNLRVNPDNGQAVDGNPTVPGAQTDSMLVYDIGDSNTARDAAIVGLANTNNAAGAANTTTYGIDANQDVLVTVGSVGGTSDPPSSGTLYTVGALGFDTTEVSTAFDISPSGDAFAAFTAANATTSTLARINLSTGRATIVGSLTGIVLRGLAIPVPDPVRRLSGQDRLLTAIAISQHDFPAQGSAAAVVLARADVFADALSGTPLAVAKGGPLLLSGSESLTPATRTEIQRVASVGRQVHILGGTSALSAAIDTELLNLGYSVVRYAGTDRFDTSIRIARTGLGEPANLLLATGFDFPAALVSGPAAAKVGGAVLLTAGTALTAGTRSYLQEHPSAARFAVGQDAAIADRSAVAVGNTAERYEMAREVAEHFFSSTYPTVGIASGQAFPDGLAGGAHIGRRGGALLLTQPDVLPTTVRTYLESKRAEIKGGFLYGGPVAVNESVRIAVQTAIN